MRVWKESFEPEETLDFYFFARPRSFSKTRTTEMMKIL